MATQERLAARAAKWDARAQKAQDLGRENRADRYAARAEKLQNRADAMSPQLQQGGYPQQTQQQSPQEQNYDYKGWTGYSNGGMWQGMNQMGPQQNYNYASPQQSYQNFGPQQAYNAPQQYSGYTGNQYGSPNINQAISNMNLSPSQPQYGAITGGSYFNTPQSQQTTMGPQGQQTYGANNFMDFVNSQNFNPGPQYTGLRDVANQLGIPDWAYQGAKGFVSAVNPAAGYAWDALNMGVDLISGKNMSNSVAGALPFVDLINTLAPSWGVKDWIANQINTAAQYVGLAAPNALSWSGVGAGMADWEDQGNYNRSDLSYDVGNYADWENAVGDYDYSGMGYGGTYDSYAGPQGAGGWGEYDAYGGPAGLGDPSYGATSYGAYTGIDATAGAADANDAYAGQVASWGGTDMGQGNAAAAGYSGWGSNAVAWGGGSTDSFENAFSNWADNGQAGNTGGTNTGASQGSMGTEMGFADVGTASAEADTGAAADTGTGADYGGSDYGGGESEGSEGEGSEGDGSEGSEGW